MIRRLIAFFRRNPDPVFPPECWACQCCSQEGCDNAECAHGCPCTNGFYTELKRAVA